MWEETCCLQIGQCIWFCLPEQINVTFSLETPSLDKVVVACAMYFSMPCIAYTCEYSSCPAWQSWLELLHCSLTMALSCILVCGKGNHYTIASAANIIFPLLWVSSWHLHISICWLLVTQVANDGLYHIPVSCMVSLWSLAFTSCQAVIIDQLHLNHTFGIIFI